jgi:hypothetical protein
VNTYALVMFLHVLLFAYWLGSDLGVFICSLTARRADVSADARARLQQAGVLIDMAPRTCLVLIVPTGLTLAANFGAPIQGPALALVWVASLLWLWLVWQVHWKHGAPIGRTYWRIDFAIRLAVMVGFLGVGLWCLATGAPIAERWLGAKILIFGLIILCGVIVRILLLRMEHAPAPPPAATGAASRAADGRDLIRRVVLVIWALVAVAAFLGVTKPF